MIAGPHGDVDLLDLALITDAIELLSQLAARWAPSGADSDDDFSSILGQVRGAVEQIRGRHDIEEDSVWGHES